jgi:predicted ester cyclase
MTLAGARAQKSPQADLFLAYEKALIWQGMDEASPYMTPEKLADMRGMLQQFGADGFKEFQTRMRETVPQGEARRRTIEKLTVDGDTAVLEARSGPHAVDVARMVKTKDGWKITK